MLLQKWRLNEACSEMFSSHKMPWPHVQEKEQDSILIPMLEVARHGHLDTEPVRCLHCQGTGHMSCAHVFELRNCDAYSSTCHGATSCHSHLQSRARQRAGGAVRPEAAMRAAHLVRGLRRAVLIIVQECLGHSVRPFHTTCIRLFLIFH